MPSAPESAGLKAVRYAEDNLNVHGIYDQAVSARNRLDGVLTNLSSMRDKRREAEEALRDREMEIAADEWGKNPEFSATKMEGHLKSVRHADFQHTALRGEISQIVGDIEGLEFDRAVAETDIKIAVARLQELGGYLNYLAAIKQAETTNKSREA